MNSNQRNNITEIMPEEQFLTYSSDSHVVVLIKHDYYSTDDSHGRLLLNSFVESLYNSEKEIAAIYLVSSGVKVVSDLTVGSFIEKIVAHHGASVYACSESISQYSIDLSSIAFDVNEMTAFEFFTELSAIDKLVVIE